MALTRITDKQVTYKNGANGSVVRSVGDKLREVISVEDFGAVGDGVTDDGASIQAASDSAETSGKCLEFDGSKTYRINQNLYLGNCTWKTNGAVFIIVSDSSFVTVGTATNKTEGVILSKSSNGAGYGYSTIKFAFDQLNISFSRPVNGVACKTAMLLENIESFTGELIYGSTPDGQDTSKCLLDLYSGVQNFNVGIVRIYIRNGNQAEGTWIRNCSPSRETANIHIGLFDCDYQGADEALAIYPFTIGLAGDPDVRDVRIDVVKLITYGGHGISFIDLSGAAYSPTRMKNLSIGSVDITVIGSRNTAFYIKSDSCSPSIDNVSIVLNDLTGINGNSFCIRGIKASEQEAYMTIRRADIALNAVVPSGDLYGIYGRVVVDEANITSTLGSFKALVSSNAHVERGNLYASCTYAGDNAIYLGRGVSVKAPCQGIQEFYGTIYADTTLKNAARWLLHSNATVIPLIGVKIDAKVVISGGGTITQLVNCNNTTATYDIPVDVKLRVQNSGDISIPENYYGGKFKLTAHDMINVRSTGALRVTKALSL